MLKIVEFSKISIKIKNCKTIVNLFSHPLSHPSPETIFFKEIYINIQKFAFKVLQECSSWASGNIAAQIFFLTPHGNMFAEKFVKSERF